MKTFFSLLFAVVLGWNAQAQHHQHQAEPDPHHHRHPLRLALLIGYGMVPEVGGEGVFFVPTWGMDVDYHLNDHWSIGWHSDIELENYLIENDLGETIELQTPMVSTLDIFYRLSHNVLLGVGPGLTIENGEMKTLMRVGIEGEVPMNDRWDWTPTLYLDQRIDGHQVWTFAVGVAHYL
jgi:hypothetical protein